MGTRASSTSSLVSVAGLLEIERFLHLKQDAKELRTASDVADVLAILKTRGLPAELTSTDMKLADGT
jgi:hypothetical protein